MKTIEDPSIKYSKDYIERFSKERPYFYMSCDDDEKVTYIVYDFDGNCLPIEEHLLPNGKGLLMEKPWELIYQYAIMINRGGVLTDEDIFYDGHEFCLKDARNHLLSIVNASWGRGYEKDTRLNIYRRNKENANLITLLEDETIIKKTKKHQPW